ncbi:MAG: hypothetical protein J2P13_00920, partial [Acidobacteria bacterium]|nr:hypothetical protein [Acidobacteriota bacterium]
MLVREGFTVNHKRVYRLYREERLAMRIRARRRIRWEGAKTKPGASRVNEKWSMDFVSDCVSSSGKVIRMLTIVDDCTRECLAIEVDTSLGFYDIAILRQSFARTVAPIDHSHRVGAACCSSKVDHHLLVI